MLNVAHLSRHFLELYTHVNQQAVQKINIFKIIFFILIYLFNSTCEESGRSVVMNPVRERSVNNKFGNELNRSPSRRG